MKICLFGIGYAGSISAACLARDGHDVTAIDINPEKVAALNRGRAPMLEPGLEALICSGVENKRLSATASPNEALAEADISIVCVGTPNASDGALDLTALDRVLVVIGQAISTRSTFHVITVRSTLTPGSMTGHVVPLIEQVSGLQAGVGFGLAYHPEFLREGSAVFDYDHPSHSILASTDAETTARLLALQSGIRDPPTFLCFGEAEAVKMVNNAWRGVKVSFANEIGGVLGGIGIDSHRVMQALLQGERSDQAPAYLKPGFAFGGSCLPKDIAALATLGAAKARPTPMLEAALQLNRAMINRAISMIEATGRSRVSIIGLAFKPGTDDLRESPYVELARRLIDTGYDVRLFDPEIRPDRLMGANLAHALDRLPDLETLLCDTLEEAVVHHAETLVLGHGELGAAALNLRKAGQKTVDLVRVNGDLRTNGDYAGLAW